MTRDAILAIDQGTSNSKAILINREGLIIAQGSSPLETVYPQPGWVEQSATEIWQSVLKAVAECLQQAPGIHILGIGISNQRESVVCWDQRTGKPLGPALTWQCRRTAKDTERLKAEGQNEPVQAITGLPLDPLFPAMKVRWLLEHSDSQNRCVGTVDSWLIWNLSGGRCFATDRSNASRTQLFNVKTAQWDTGLCELFGVDSTVLAEVHDSQHTFGYTHQVPVLDDGIPIAAAIGDSHAALFGHTAFQAGDAKATFGTGSSVMMVTPEFKPPQQGMTTTIAWSIDNTITYALEGNILVSASLFPWAAKLLGQNGVDELLKLAESVEDAGGVSLVPALVGLGAPHWQPQAQGIITGLSFNSSPAHIAHAAALSMPLQVVDVFAAMRQQSSTLNGEIFVDGGPTRNLFLMQYLADLMDQTITVCKDPELSALGAGMLAGLEVGYWSSLEEITQLKRERFKIKPTMSADKRAEILRTWQKAVGKCIESDHNTDSFH